jgi:hypothetical protein
LINNKINKEGKKMKTMKWLGLLVVAVLVLGTAGFALTSNPIEIRDMKIFLERNVEVKEIQYPYYSLGWRKEILFVDIPISFYPAEATYQRFPNKLYVILGRFPLELEVEAKNILSAKPKRVNADVDAILVLEFGSEADLDLFIQTLTAIAERKEEVVIRATPEITLNLNRINRIIAGGSLAFFMGGEVFLRAI